MLSFKQLQRAVIKESAVDDKLEALIDNVIRYAKFEGLYEGLRDTSKLGRDHYETKLREMTGKRIKAVDALRSFMA